MADKRNGKGVPADMFMKLAENAKAVNIYAGLGPSGQQMFLERYSLAGSAEEQKRLIDELTK